MECITLFWLEKGSAMKAGRKLASLALCTVMTASLFACNSKGQDVTKPSGQEYEYNHELNILDDKYRNYYEVFLYSFCDSNGDGIGDINGLISKLDYINDGNDATDTDLGFTGIWLMPIMPSPSYHKYNVTDYYAIDKQYGTLDDMKRLIEECHKRNIKLIIDLVVNHTAKEHPWFQQATDYLKTLKNTKNPDASNCKYVSYYNFTREKNKAGYVALSGSDWYYEANFDEGMPDLNLDNKDVRKEIESIIDYWMELGVDGFRLDGAKEYYSGSTDKNTKMVGYISDYVHKKKEDAYVVAEAWQDFYTMVKYYRSGVDSLFNFEFSQIDGDIASDLLEADGKQFAKDMIRVQSSIHEINDQAIDAEFFTNHDTVRAASALGYKPEKIKMAAGMTLLCSGTIFTYYGEEIGMTGSGADPNKRAPMYWNDSGEGMAVGPSELEQQTKHFESVEKQMEDPDSIYNYYKRAVRIRNENPEIARGKVALIESVTDQNITAITKTYNGSKLILLYNLSKETKQVILSQEEYGYEGIRGYLTANGEKVDLDGENITLPPYSIAILK